MKIGCLCGNTLRDQTDCIPYKGYLWADQDHYGFMETLQDTVQQALNGASNSDEVASRVTDAIWKKLLPLPRRTTYQC